MEKHMRAGDCPWAYNEDFKDEACPVCKKLDKLESNDWRKFDREKVSAENHKKRQIEQIKSLMKQCDEFKTGRDALIEMMLHLSRGEDTCVCPSCMLGRKLLRERHPDINVNAI